MTKPYPVASWARSPRRAKVCTIATSTTPVALLPLPPN